MIYESFLPDGIYFYWFQRFFQFGNICALLILILFPFCAPAQSKTVRPSFNKEMISFFEGSWSGSGHFSNGREISADANFQLSLDSSWLVYNHSDKLPNKYKAISMWSTSNVNDGLVDYVFDNFRGHRLFTSDGWQAGKLILINKDSSPSGTASFQRFIYLKLSERSFKMSYEVSKDGITWRLGDSLTFTKDIK